MHAKMASASLADRYRRTGADPPFGDPAGYHGVAMEGWFWRFSDAATGVVVIVLLAISRDAAGRPWGMIGLASHPGGFVRSLATEEASAAPRGIDVRAGTALTAGPRSLRVDLGAGARLDVAFEDVVGWPSRRAFGGIGPAQVVPCLSQYWHPWLLGGRARGTATLGGRTVALDGAAVYAEKNWGAGGMPDTWWWGQAQGFPGRDDVCVAFAGGRAGLGPLHVTAGALVVRLGDEVLRVVRPLQPMGIDLGDGRWRLRGRTLRDVVEVDGHVTAEPHLLPVPVPGTREHLDARAPQHLTGDLHLRVTRGNRVRFDATSPVAGLEQGRGVS
jgi:hypothetical protein